MADDNGKLATSVRRDTSKAARPRRRDDPDRVVRDLMSGDLETRERAEADLSHDGTQFVPSLLRVLTKGDAHQRATSVRILSAIHDPSIAPTLTRALDDDDVSVRWEAGRGLIALGRSGITTALHALITHQLPAPQLKASIRQVLLGVDDEGLKDILTPVLRALEHHVPDEELMVTAYKAIAILADREP